jgi:protoporphyrinogen oxidase
MMWEKARDLIEGMGGRVVLNSPVVRIECVAGRATDVLVASPDGAEERHPIDALVSTMPIAELVRSITPPAPAEVLAAADGLKHRDFLTVALVVPDKAGFPDNWIYIHTPGVRVGRVQNFGSWSPYLVKDGKTCLGLEYFVNQGDDLWQAPDDELIGMAKREIGALGLVPQDSVEDGFVVRVPKAYPVYDEGYRERVEVLRSWLAENATNVHPIGRNGMHRYNNQDHSMLTAMLVAENISTGSDHDPWTVNVEEEYHEQEQTGEVVTGREAPVFTS